MVVNLIIWSLNLHKCMYFNFMFICVIVETRYFVHYVYTFLYFHTIPLIKPFIPMSLKWTLPSLNLVRTIVPNRGLSQKSKQNGKQCRSWWDGSSWIIYQDLHCLQSIFLVGKAERVKQWTKLIKCGHLKYIYIIDTIFTRIIQTPQLIIKLVLKFEQIQFTTRYCV